MFAIRGAFVTGDEPAAPWRSYLRVAMSLAPGLRALDPDNPEVYAAHAFLSCHMLECVLKAYLSRTSAETYLQSPAVRHNLERLWELSSEQGLQVLLPTPVWVQQLGFLHDKPFYLRYAPSVGGVAMPNPEPGRGQLLDLLTYVNQVVGQGDQVAT